MSIVTRQGPSTAIQPGDDQQVAADCGAGEGVVGGTVTGGGGVVTSTMVAIGTGSREAYAANVTNNAIDTIWYWATAICVR
jgi:hypothetical protein